MAACALVERLSGFRAGLAGRVDERVALAQKRFERGAACVRHRGEHSAQGIGELARLLAARERGRGVDPLALTASSIPFPAADELSRPSVATSRSIARSAPVKAMTASGSGSAVAIVIVGADSRSEDASPLTTSSAPTSFAARTESAMGRERVVWNARVSASNHV